MKKWAQGFVEIEVPRGVTFQVNLAEGTDSARGCASQRMRCPMVRVMTPIFFYFSRMTLHYGYLLEVEFMKLHLFFLSKKVLQNFREFFFLNFFARKVDLCVLERYFLENFGDHFVIPELGPCRPQQVFVDCIKGGISPQKFHVVFGPHFHGCFFDVSLSVEAFGLDELNFVVIFEAS